MSSPAWRRLACFVAAVTSIAFGSLTFAQSPARPNVLVILSDDQGYGDFSCHVIAVLRLGNRVSVL
jgi:hypothetical protein